MKTGIVWLLLFIIELRVAVPFERRSPVFTAGDYDTADDYDTPFMSLYSSYYI